MKRQQRPLQLGDEETEIGRRMEITRSGAGGQADSDGAVVETCRDRVGSLLPRQEAACVGCGRQEVWERATLPRPSLAKKCEPCFTVKRT